MIYKKEEIEAFLNALQLCIQSKVSLVEEKDIKSDKTLSQLASSNNLLFFIHSENNDPNLKKITVLFRSYKLINIEEPKEEVLLAISDPELNLPDLTAFLLLSRLSDDKMTNLVNKDSRYETIARRLNIPNMLSSAQIRSVEEASQKIFKEIESQGITLRKLSQESSLTQAMLSKFKNRNDVRLSSLLKILNALGLKLIIEK